MGGKEDREHVLPWFLLPSFSIFARECRIRLEVPVVFVGQRRSLGRLELLLVLGHEVLVDLHLRRSQGRRSNELETRVAHKLAREPQEGLLEVVVRSGGNLKVLEVLLSVEGDRARLDFSLLVHEVNRM